MTARDALRTLRGRFSGRPLAARPVLPDADFWQPPVPQDLPRSDVTSSPPLARAPLDYPLDACCVDPGDDFPHHGEPRACRGVEPPLAARPMFTLAETVLLTSLGAIGATLVCVGISLGGG